MTDKPRCRWCHLPFDKHLPDIDRPEDLRRRVCPREPIKHDYYAPDTAHAQLAAAQQDVSDLHAAMAVIMEKRRLSGSLQERAEAQAAINTWRRIGATLAPVSRNSPGMISSDA